MSIASFAPLNIRQPMPPPDMPPDSMMMENEDEVYDGLIPQEDGSLLVVNHDSGKSKKDAKFSDNLADYLEESELSMMAGELLEGIEADIRSRKEWEETFARGIEMLGLKLEMPGSDVTSQGFISKVHHPLLLESIIRYQSNFRAEMLPVSGPVKVRDDRPKMPEPPKPPMMGHNGGPPMADAPAMPPAAPPVPQGGGMGAPTPQANGIAGQMPPAPEKPTRDDVAQAFEDDFNHYLTAVDKPYYPDTDRMSFGQALCGCAFKKVYRCPIERRPISRFVLASDLIVSSSASSLHDARRVTHRIPMSQVTMIRMKLSGAYRDVDLSIPVEDDDDTVGKKINEIEGITPQNRQRPEDTDYTVMECYTYLDLKGFEHKEKGKETGLPLPYRVVIEKTSRQVLEIRRNYVDGDEDFKPKRRFVKYSFIPGLGFYDYGYVHILGNTNRALTAIERQLIDAGQFQNFPGGLINEMAARQETNQFRPGPGMFKPIKVPGGLRVQDMAMPFPYQGPSAALAGFFEKIEENGRRLGSTTELSMGEGTQNVPVGTVIAMIEQSTKDMSAIHKRNHTAQQEEFELLRDLFVEDPEVLWKFSKNPARKWQVSEEFSDMELVPASDPNTPSHIHRLAKNQALFQMAQAAPQLFNVREVAERILRALGVEDIDSVLNHAQPQSPPDTKSIAKLADIQAKQQQMQADAQNSAMDHSARMAELQEEGNQKALDRQNDLQIEHLRLVETAMRDSAKRSHDLANGSIPHINGGMQ